MSAGPARTSDVTIHITVAGTPERGIVMARMKDLVAFARQQGYRPAEVIAMIKAVS